MKKAIYTVITEGYDTLRPMPSLHGWDCICFTDDPDMSVNGWDMRLLDKSDNPVRQQRKIKILAHEFLPEYDLTIYIDGNVEVIRDPSGLVRQFKGGLMTKIHPRRNCVYQEGQACIDLGKADPQDITSQLKKYIDEGVPAQGGMWETGVMVRDRSVKEFCEAWWEELELGTHRDQMAISAAVHKTGFKIHGVPHNVITSHFRNYQHKPKKEIRVWYSNPYCTRKDIGDALNEFCEAVPDDDWICLQDGDIMYLTPDWGRQIEDVITRHGNDYDLFGCMTNRLGGRTQLVPGMYDETDILKHYEKAIELSEKHWAEVEPIRSGVAGMFMLFKKSTWKKHRFAEGAYSGVKFDTQFGKDILRSRGRVGLIKGLYVLHLYRMWSEARNPISDIRHLV